MRNVLGLRGGLAAVLFLAAQAAVATVNHGDFLGTSVDFLQVSETTLSADPEPLWGAPTLVGSGDQLSFSPNSFLSLCAAGASDVTTSELTTEINAHAGGHIETVMLVENGDVTLTRFPPFGDASTNASASLSGTLTVTETTSGPITPVVIPFTGTFTPQSSFALPTKFGTNTWSGSISIDVLSSVPLATKATLSLNNHLATNCGPGNSNAKIQKKFVTGPSVAILVNPVECDLQINKTCCVTQPVLPDLDSCDGVLERLVLEYNGEGCGGCSNNQGGELQCAGRRPIGEDADISVLSTGVIATPSTDLDYGDIVELTSTSGQFGAKTKLKVFDSWWRRQYLKIDTSCMRAIKCGDQLGAFKVVGIESTLGGVVDCNAPPPPPVCAQPGDPAGTPCDAKLVDMVLEYNGQACQNPLANPQNGEAQCSGDATGATDVGVIYAGKFGYAHKVTPASGINDGDRIRVTSTLQSGGLFPNQKLLITDSGGVVQEVAFHVSCSQPLALGDEFGSFKLVEFTTKAGTHVSLGEPQPPAESCEVPLAPPGPHCTSDMRDITLVYIGDYLGLGCTVSNPQGGYGSCSGAADPGDPVSVTVASGLQADPPDQIEFGDLVNISSMANGDLPGLTAFSVTGAGGTQNIQIKTSCWKPLSLGDRFGSFVVFGMNREDDGPISLGGNVQYQYTVSNPNTSTVDNIEVTDDQLGVIASGVSIPAGQSQTFTKDATLFGTTTNVATATGDVGGDICTPGVDTLTVNVTAPPPGAFSCSEPITELTLTWNGSQTIDVRVWQGAEFASPMLASFDNVAPGDAITVSGFSGASYPTFEVLNSVTSAKLGESTFDLWCNDPSMNSIEDCGKNNGNLKWNYSNLNNDWLLEGMVDSDEDLSCTPGLVANPPCGFGPELILVLPGLLVWHRRKLRKEA